MDDSNPICLTGANVRIHTVPLPAEAKVLILVEFNDQVTHVIALEAQAGRDLVVGLLEALDLVSATTGPDDLSALEDRDDDEGA